MRAVDLGANVSYASAMQVMREAMARVDDDGPVILLLEHTPVITTTRSGGTAFVTSSKEALEAQGIELHETDRGGDVTFHGPGQLVGYPVIRLCEPLSRGDFVGYVRALEDGLVRAAQRIGIADAHPRAGMTGVWCGAPPSKLTAIGVGVSRGVTRHGFALNMTTDVERYTQHIVPCGLVGEQVTSLARLMPVTPSRDDVIRAVVEELTTAFRPWLERTP